MLPQEAVKADSIRKLNDRLAKFRSSAWQVLKGLGKDAPSHMSDKAVDPGKVQGRRTREHVQLHKAFPNPHVPVSPLEMEYED